MTQKPARFRWRKLSVALVALLAPVGGALVYRQLRPPEQPTEAAANQPAPTAPQTSVGALKVAPEGPVPPTPAAPGPSELSAPSASVAAATPAPVVNKPPVVWQPKPRPPAAKPADSARPAEPAARPATQASGLSDFGGRR
jgi:hypothetical protein